MCIVRATVGVVAMWDCEVRESMTSELGISATHSAHQYQKFQTQTPPVQQETSCSALPHGTCNYLVAIGISLNPPTLLSVLDRAHVFHYSGLAYPTPIKPPRA